MFKSYVSLPEGNQKLMYQIWTSFFFPVRFLLGIFQTVQLCNEKTLQKHGKTSAAAGFLGLNPALNAMASPFHPTCTGTEESNCKQRNTTAVGQPKATNDRPQWPAHVAAVHHFCCRGHSVCLRMRCTLSQPFEYI